MVDFEKELQRCFWTKTAKSIFEFFKHSLDQKHAREALNK